MLGDECGGDFEFARPAASQVSAADELGVVHHPIRAKIVLVTHKTFVQGQIGADGILTD